MAAAGTPLVELFATYKQDIAQVLTNLGQFLKANPDYNIVITKDFALDELLVTKYLLSGPKRMKKSSDTLVGVVTEAIINTFKFRLEHHELLLKVARMDNEAIMNNGYLPVITGGLMGSEIISVCPIGAVDLRDLVKPFDTSLEFALAGLQSSEKARMFIDQESRRTGKLVKILSVTDLTGLSLMRLSSPKALQGMGTVSAWNDDHNPQFLSKTCLVNAPSLFGAMLKMAKPFFSKSTMDKMLLCKRSGGKKDINDCPFLKKYGAEVGKHFPQSVGGTA
ncbi:hypothetical protein BASA81_005501 [Batrachochytrium salamandrivorans]|nr:hypothetical protein BASA81_005501 [Batrachochytrium salamandrivorans]